MSTRTIKVPYSVTNNEDKKVILDYVKNYNSVLKFTFNRLKDCDFDISTKQLTELQKTMNNVFVDSHFLNSAQHEARQLKGKNKVIFGGKDNFIKRCQQKISRKEFELNKLIPLYSVGEACKQGNRKFTIVSENCILFKPCRNIHVNLMLPKLRCNYNKDIIRLKRLQDLSSVAITYKLDLNYIYIIFDESKMRLSDLYSKIKDRVFAIDLNPNYIGWSVVDWADSETYSVIGSGVVSNKQINDLEYKLHKASCSKERIYLNNKRTFENADTAKYLAELAKHYQCELFSIEKLEIPSRDNRYGRKYNRLVNNQWNRNIFYNQLRKYCDRLDIKFYEVVANYSSFEGNLTYRETRLPDMCLASIELGRRAYEFHHQYVLQDKPKQKKKVKTEVDEDDTNYYEEDVTYQLEEDVFDVFNIYAFIRIINTFVECLTGDWHSDTDIRVVTYSD